METIEVAIHLLKYMYTGTVVYITSKCVYIAWIVDSRKSTTSIQMSSSKIQKLKEFFRNGGACGCAQKGTDVIEPKPKSISGGGEDCSSTTFSFNIEHCAKIEDSFAVVKDTDDPYQDFRQSMLQMIIDREMYSRNDLQQLLQCFLQLNSPHHHDVILRAFTDIAAGTGIPPTTCVMPRGSCDEHRSIN